MVDVLVGDMRLVDADTSEELVLSPSADNGGVIKVVDFTPGFPAVRAVQVQNPGYNGATDYTRFYGAKAVALVVRLDPSSGQPIMPALAGLRAWCAPGRRVQLVYTPSGMAERILYLRGDQLGADLPMASMISGVVDVQLQWACPDGVEYSSATTQTTVMMQTPITTGGRTYPLTYPRTYPAQTGTGVAVVTNAGTVPSAPVIRAFGPCVGPAITNETTGQVLAMAGYSLSSTDYVEIDMAAKTVQLRGVPGADANRRSRATTAQWWSLAPGDNTIRFTAESGSVPAQLLVLSQDAWI
ncbi:MAG: hypothetical protein ABW046_20635 [Actinoplanes sp.]